MCALHELCEEECGKETKALQRHSISPLVPSSNQYSEVCIRSGLFQTQSGIQLISSLPPPLPTVHHVLL